MAVTLPVKGRPKKLDSWEESDTPLIDPDNVPRGYELIDGQLVEKPKRGFESGFISTKVIRLLGNFLDEYPIAEIASSDATFALNPEKPLNVRKPDAAVILCDPKTFIPPRTNYTKAPEILVEVVSPNDTITDLERKVKEFLQAGTKLVWIINPELRDASIRRANGTTQIEESGELTGEDILPGFRLPLAKLFPPIGVTPAE